MGTKMAEFLKRKRNDVAEGDIVRISSYADMKKEGSFSAYSVRFPSGVHFVSQMKKYCRKVGRVTIMRNRHIGCKDLTITGINDYPERELAKNWTFTDEMITQEIVKENSL